MNTQPKVSNDNKAIAPDDDVYLMFDKLTQENKEKVKRFIAGLKEKQ